MQMLGIEVTQPTPEETETVNAVAEEEQPAKATVDNDSSSEGEKVVTMMYRGQVVKRVIQSAASAPETAVKPKRMYRGQPVLD